MTRSGKRGFPWQASIGADILEAEFIPNGSQIQVNGRTFDGPLYVIRQSILKEISFVDTGADTHKPKLQSIPFRWGHTKMKHRIEIKRIPR